MNLKKLLPLMAVVCFVAPIVSAQQNPPLEPPYTKAPSKSSSNTKIEKPSEIDKETGDYYYRPSKSNGEIRYKVKPPPIAKEAAYLRFGTIGPYDITSDNNATYKDVYTNSASVVVYGEYERSLGNMLGNWSLKFGSGVTTETGTATFANPPAIGGSPEEKFTLLVFPNTTLVSYKLRFSDTQLVIPYAEAGGGYFTFVEYRDDGNHTAFGGAAALAFTGGLLVSLNSLDATSASYLYEDYGVSHLYLDLQFRQNVGLDDKKDFTSNMITGGFGFAF